MCKYRAATTLKQIQIHTNYFFALSITNHLHLVLNSCC